MSGSWRGQETGEGFGLWREKGLEVHTAHDPVLHMNVFMCNPHEHNWLPSTKWTRGRVSARPALKIS